MTRALFASYRGPLFKALRVSDNQEKDISHRGVNRVCGPGEPQQLLLRYDLQGEHALRSEWERQRHVAGRTTRT